MTSLPHPRRPCLLSSRRRQPGKVARRKASPGQTKSAEPLARSIETAAPGDGSRPRRASRPTAPTRPSRIEVLDCGSRTSAPAEPARAWPKPMAADTEPRAGQATKPNKIESPRTGRPQYWSAAPALPPFLPIIHRDQPKRKKISQQLVAVLGVIPEDGCRDTNELFGSVQRTPIDE